MSSRFAIPNNPASAGSRSPAPGMSTGDLTGRLNTPHPYNPESRKKAVAAMYPANLESPPNFPKVIFWTQLGKSSLVVSVASRSNEIESRTNGSAPRRVS